MLVNPPNDKEKDGEIGDGDLRAAVEREAQALEGGLSGTPWIWRRRPLRLRDERPVLAVRLLPHLFLLLLVAPPPDRNMETTTATETDSNPRHII